MARRAGNGKTTVESCRSIDVLEWNQLGYFRSPRLFSRVWTRGGEPSALVLAQIDRNSVTIKHWSRSGNDWTNAKQRIPIVWTACCFGGERPWFLCPVRSNGACCGRQVTKL